MSFTSRARACLVGRSTSLSRDLAPRLRGDDVEMRVPSWQTTATSPHSKPPCSPRSERPAIWMPSSACASPRLGRKGRVPELMAKLGTLAARSAQGVRPGRQRPEGAGEPGAGRAQERPGERPALRAPRHRAGRRHPAGAHRAAAGGAHPSRQPGLGRGGRKSSATWASRSPRVPISRPTTSTSPSSTSRPSIRRGRSTTPST